MLGEVILRNARLRGDAPAVIFEDRTLTHRGLADRALRLADGLKRLGVGRGDRVAILSQNRPEYLEIYAAGELGGWITVTINFRLTGPEVAYILGDSRPKVLIVEEQYRDLIEPGPFAVVVLGDGKAGDLSYEDVVASGTPEELHASADDVAYLIYTSGTTGRPKGVMLLHRGQLASAQISALENRLGPTDKVALAMPLYHIGGLNTRLAHALVGATILLFRAFRPSAFLESVRTHGATTTLLAPTMVNDLLELGGFDRTTVPELRSILYSAAPMPEPILRRGIGALGNIFMQVYGMTETGGPGSVLHAYAHAIEGPAQWVRRLRSAGQAMVGCDVRVVSPDGSLAAAGERGEVVIRSPGAMAGYWNNHVASAVTLRDGTIHTGDVGEMDEDGFLFIVDRIKDMIVSGGENIYSREVEDALLAHPAVAEAAVVGAPDPRWGEKVVAFVVTRAQHAPSEDELISHCRTLIAGYKRPREVRFIAALPKLPNGKIEKYKLREPLWS